MATATQATKKKGVLVQEHLKCPICLETYKRPRSLICLHTYCENCLQDVINKNADKWVGRRKIICPLCKTDTAVPSATVKLQEWVKELPMNDAIAFLLRNVNSKKEDVKSCQPCADDNVVKVANSFCVQCDCYQCNDCVKNHAKYPVMKQHTINNLNESSNGKNPPQFDLGMIEKCLIHTNKGIEFFCQDHSLLCCSTCAFDEHRNCQKVLNVTLLGQEIKERKRIQDLQSNMESTQSGMDSIIKTLDATFTNVGAQSETIRASLEKTREDLIKKMDDIVEKISKERESLKQKHEEILSKKIKTNKGVYAAVVASRSVLDFALNHGSDAQVYIAFHKVEEQFKKYTKTLQTEQAIEATVDLKLKLGDVVLSMIHSSDYVAGIYDIKTYSIPLADFKTSQIFSGDVHPNTGSDTPYISGVAYLLDGRVIYTDSRNRLCCLLDESYSVADEIKLPSHPRNLAVLGNSEIVVALYKEKMLQFVAVKEKLSLTRTVLCKREPWSVARVNESELAVGWWKAGAGIITMDGKERIYLDKDTEGRLIQFEEHDFIAVDAGRLRFYQSSYNKNTMYCFEFDGKPVFAYKNKYLGKPTGVAIDRDGNAYVCSCNTARVHQVSIQGVLLRTIDLGLFHPYTINFNAAGDQFVVANNSANRIPRLAVHRLVPS